MYQRRSSNRRSAGVTLAAVVMMALAACTGASAGDKSDPDTELTFIGIPKTLDNVAYAVARDGAEKRIEELGGNIKLEWVAPAGADPAKQAQMIESYVQRGVDGIFVAALGPSVCNAIDAAIAAGIPVITFDSDCPDSTRTSYVGSDNYEGGYAAGEMFVEHVKDKGPQRIAILTGMVGATNLAERDAGFKKSVEDSGIDHEFVVTVAGNDDLTKSVEAVESTLRGDPTINAFYFDGPWPMLVDRSNLPVMVGMIESGDLTVVSFDSIQPQLSWVADDLVIGLVGQKYYAWGYQSIQVLNGIVRNGSNFGEIVNTGIDVVTKNGGEGGPAAGQYSVAEMNHAWDTSDFAETPIEPK